MHPDVKKLLAVQKVDQSLARLRRELESIPLERAQRTQRLAALRLDLARIEKEKSDAELRIRDLDLSIRQSDGEIKNLEGKLGMIKNNAEYQAILFQIEAVKKERDGYEEESLVLMDKTSPLAESRAKAKAAVESEEKIFEDFETEAKKLVAAQQIEIERVGAGRAALVAEIPAELVDEYGRLFDVRDNLAIAAAEAQYCQGCYTQFTMNDLARLQGGRTVVRCSNCQRILYLAR